MTFIIGLGFPSSGDELSQGFGGGLDDGSRLTASLYLAGSSSMPFQTAALLSPGQGWSILGDQVIKVALKTPVTATALGSVTLTFLPGQDETSTLNLTGVEVSLSIPGGSPPPVTLLQTAAAVGGLTSANPTVTLLL